MSITSNEPASLTRRRWRFNWRNLDHQMKSGGRRRSPLKAGTRNLPNRPFMFESLSLVILAGFSRRP